ncbi:SET5 [Symbiodinium natans]|uniref:SET5 protein n=1 Tax=Symbiodinium natans TaxID=878477 RepID=A0A812UIE1_9DINO|nr:SET5 [Symbiodinium natans]
MDANGIEFREVEGRGRAVIAKRDFQPGILLFEEPALVFVKTWMILTGVIVFRRDKVEHKYEALLSEEKSQYRSLYPVCEEPHTERHGERHGESTESGGQLRNRGRTPEASPSPASPTPLTSQQHLQIWDNCGFHYCDSLDDQRNQILHVVVCPALLSAITGCAYAYRFQAQYVKSVLAAGVLFFAIVGPVCYRLFYFGSQAIFVKASRLNHSCQPNAEWQVDAVGEAKHAPTLSLRTKQRVKKGEELTIDYIRELPDLKQSERRKLLQQDYGFLCTCTRCTRCISDDVEELEAEER